MDLEQARFNMIEQQVRTWDVLDLRVLDVLKAVPREDFAPSRYRRMAFADLRLPLAMGQVMMKPVEEGRMLQALAVEPGDSVLEIGTGSGFCAACLSALGADVLSVELYPELADSARTRLQRHGFAAVEVRQADVLETGFNPGRQFARVVVTASLADIPPSMREWVAPGGRLFAIRGHSPAMEAICLHRDTAGAWREESLFETDLPRLVGAEDAPVFDF